MNIKVWPFLISRNKTLGYFTIAAPEFLIENKLSMLLAEVAGGELTEQGYASYREIHGSPVGNLTLVFRVVRAEKRFIGEKEEGVLRDYHGRIIDWIEGVVLRDIMPKVVITDNVLQSAHIEVEKWYREFWKETTNFFITKPSQSFSLELNSHEDGQLILKKETPFVIALTKEKQVSWQVQSPLDIVHLPIKSLGLSSTGEHMVILGETRDKDDNVRIYSFNKPFSNSLKLELDVELFNAISFAFHPKGKSIAFGLNKKGISEVGTNLLLWDLPYTKGASPIKLHDNEKQKTVVDAIAFDPTGKFLITISCQGDMLIWDIEKRKVQYRINNDMQFKCVAFHPDGKRVAAGSYSNSTYLYSLLPLENTNLPLEQQKKASDKLIIFKPKDDNDNNDHHVQSITFSPDGKILASASTDKIIYIWDIDSRNTNAKFKGHNGAVNSLAFSSDSKLLASGSDDGTIKIWSIQSRQVLSTLSGHNNIVRDVAFIKQSLNLISGSKDGTVKIWQSNNL